MSFATSSAFCCSGSTPHSRRKMLTSYLKAYDPAAVSNAPTLLARFEQSNRVEVLWTMLQLRFGRSVSSVVVSHVPPPAPATSSTSQLFLTRSASSHTPLGACVHACVVYLTQAASVTGVLLAVSSVRSFRADSEEFGPGLMLRISHSSSEDNAERFRAAAGAGLSSDGGVSAEDERPPVLSLYGPPKWIPDTAVVCCQVRVCPVCCVRCLFPPPLSDGWPRRSVAKRSRWVDVGTTAVRVVGSSVLSAHLHPLQKYDQNSVISPLCVTVSTVSTSGDAPVFLRREATLQEQEPLQVESSLENAKCIMIFMMRSVGESRLPQGKRNGKKSTGMSTSPPPDESTRLEAPISSYGALSGDDEELRPMVDVIGVPVVPHDDSNCPHTIPKRHCKGKLSRPAFCGLVISGILIASGLIVFGAIYFVGEVYVRGSHCVNARLAEV